MIGAAFAGSAIGALSGELLARLMGSTWLTSGLHGIKGGLHEFSLTTDDTARQKILLACGWTTLRVSTRLFLTLAGISALMLVLPEATTIDALTYWIAASVVAILWLNSRKHILQRSRTREN